jgi:hypothetical protein
MPEYGLRKDGTLGPEEPGMPVARAIESVTAPVVGQFVWSDQSVGPAPSVLLPIKVAALTWREPFWLSVLMGTGMLIGILGLVMVPLSWVVPSLRSRSNCLFHAFGKMHREGGYLIFTPSKHGWWTHSLHSLDLKVFEEYYPTAPKRQHRLPPVIFTGFVQPWVARGVSGKRAS